MPSLGSVSRKWLLLVPLIVSNGCPTAADWADDARDILNFLVHYLPSSSAASSLPIHLRRVSAEESEQRKSNGFRNRTLIAGGSSYGGCIMYVYYANTSDQMI